MKNLSITGFVGGDPTTKKTDSYTMSNFSVGVSDKTKDGNTTYWVQVTTFGKLAEIVDNYVRKGDKVFASGDFKMSTYTAKDGTEKTGIGIIANIVEVMNAKKDANEDAIPF